MKRKIPVAHKINKEDAVNYLQKEFNVELGEKE